VGEGWLAARPARGGEGRKRIFSACAWTAAGRGDVSHTRASHSAIAYVHGPTTEAVTIPARKSARDRERPLAGIWPAATVARATVRPVARGVRLDTDKFRAASWRGVRTIAMRSNQLVVGGKRRPRAWWVSRSWRARAGAETAPRFHGLGRSELPPPAADAELMTRLEFAEVRQPPRHDAAHVRVGRRPPRAEAEQLARAHASRRGPGDRASGRSRARRFGDEAGWLCNCSVVGP